MAREPRSANVPDLHEQYRPLEEETQYGRSPRTFTSSRRWSAALTGPRRVEQILHLEMRTRDHRLHNKTPQAVRFGDSVSSPISWLRTSRV